MPSMRLANSTCSGVGAALGDAVMVSYPCNAFLVGSTMRDLLGAHYRLGLRISRSGTLEITQSSSGGALSFGT
jgi:hypothetical protein